MPLIFRAVLLLAVFCAAPAFADQTLRLGDLGASVSTLYQRVALANGVYHKYGIDLQLVDFLSGGPELTAAAASNQIDMGSVGTPVLTAISHGLPIRVVGSPPRKGQPFILVGRPEITDIAQLKGKLVGYASVGGGSSQALAVILKAHGLTDADIGKIAYGAGGNGYQSLRSGRLAAAVMAEPYATRAEQDGTGKILAEADQYFGHYQHSYIFATRKFINEHPETIRAYFQADREARQYAKAHVEDLVALGHKSLGLDAELLRLVLTKEVAKWSDSAAIDPEALLNAVAIVRELGDISKTYQPDIDQIVDSRFAN